MFGEQFEEREGMPGVFLGDFHGRTIPPPMRKVFSFERVGRRGLTMYWKEARDKGPVGRETLSGARDLLAFCERHHVLPEEMQIRLSGHYPELAARLQRVIESASGYSVPGSLSNLLNEEARRDMLEWAMDRPEFAERIRELTGEDMEEADRIISRAKKTGK